MEERLHAPASKAAATDRASLGEIAALMGEIYLVLLAAMVVIVAMAMAIDARPAALIRIDDPAIAANFTA